MTIVAILGLILIAGIVLAIMFFVQTSEKIVWHRSKEGLLFGSSNPLADVVDGPRLDRVFRLAVEIMQPNTTELLYLSGWRYYITDSDGWFRENTGDKVAGLTVDQTHTIIIGKNLAALAHEMAHALDIYRYDATDWMHGEEWHKRWDDILNRFDEAFKELP